MLYHAPFCRVFPLDKTANDANLAHPSCIGGDRVLATAVRPNRNVLTVLARDRRLNLTDMTSEGEAGAQLADLVFLRPRGLRARGFRLTTRGSRGYDVGSDPNRILVQTEGLEGVPTVTLIENLGAWIRRAQ